MAADTCEKRDRMLCEDQYDDLVEQQAAAGAAGAGAGATSNLAAAAAAAYALPLHALPSSLPPRPLLLRRRSEGRLKLSSSCEDARAWSSNAGERRAHLVDLVTRDYEPLGTIGSVFPLSATIETLLAGKNAGIKSLRRRSNEVGDVYDGDKTPRDDGERPQTSMQPVTNGTSYQERALTSKEDEGAFEQVASAKSVPCVCPHTAVVDPKQMADVVSGSGDEVRSLKAMVQEREELLLAMLRRLEEVAAAAEGRAPSSAPSAVALAQEAVPTLPPAPPFSPKVQSKEAAPTQQLSSKDSKDSKHSQAIKGSEIPSTPSAAPVLAAPSTPSAALAPVAPSAPSGASGSAVPSAASVASAASAAADEETETSPSEPTALAERISSASTNSTENVPDLSADVSGSAVAVDGSSERTAPPSADAPSAEDATEPAAATAGADVDENVDVLSCDEASEAPCEEGKERPDDPEQEGESMLALAGAQLAEVDAAAEAGEFTCGEVAQRYADVARAMLEAARAEVKELREKRRLMRKPAESGQEPPCPGSVPASSSDDASPCARGAAALADAEAELAAAQRQLDAARGRIAELQAQLDECRETLARRGDAAPAENLDTRDASDAPTHDVVPGQPCDRPECPRTDSILLAAPCDMDGFVKESGAVEELEVEPIVHARALVAVEAQESEEEEEEDQEEAKEDDKGATMEGVEGETKEDEGEEAHIEKECAVVSPCPSTPPTPPPSPLSSALLAAPPPLRPLLHSASPNVDESDEEEPSKTADITQRTLDMTPSTVCRDVDTCPALMSSTREAPEASSARPPAPPCRDGCSASRPPPCAECQPAAAGGAARVAERARVQLRSTERLPERLRALRARALQCDALCQRVVQLEAASAAAPAPTVASRACQCSGLSQPGVDAECECMLESPPPYETSPDAGEGEADGSWTVLEQLRAEQAAEVQRLRAAAEEARRQSCELAEDRDEQAQRCQALELERATLHSCVADLTVDTARMESLEEELDELREQNMELEKRLEESSTMEAAFVDVVERLNAAEEAVMEAEEMRTRMEELEVQLEEARADLAAASAERQDDTRTRELEEERDTLLRSKCELECAVADQEDEIRRLTAALDRVAAAAAGRQLVSKIQHDVIHSVSGQPRKPRYPLKLHSGQALRPATAPQTVCEHQQHQQMQHQLQHLHKKVQEQLGQMQADAQAHASKEQQLAATILAEQERVGELQRALWKEKQLKQEDQRRYQDANLLIQQERDRALALDAQLQDERAKVAQLKGMLHTEHRRLEVSQRREEELMDTMRDMVRETAAVANSPEKQKRIFAKATPKLCPQACQKHDQVQAQAPVQEQAQAQAQSQAHAQAPPLPRALLRPQTPPQRPFQPATSFYTLVSERPSSAQDTKPTQQLERTHSENAWVRKVRKVHTERFVARCIQKCNFPRRRSVSCSHSPL